MQHTTTGLDEDFARALHIGEVAFSYYQVQRSAPSPQDYVQWLAQLPEMLSKHYASIGFEEGKNILDFRRYFLEIRLEEMKAYMQKKLSLEDYKLWLEMRQKPETLS